MSGLKTVLFVQGRPPYCAIREQQVETSPGREHGCFCTRDQTGFSKQLDGSTEEFSGRGKTNWVFLGFKWSLTLLPGECLKLRARIYFTELGLAKPVCDRRVFQEVCSWVDF